MGDVIRIESISQVHAMLGGAGPEHPLVTVIETSKQQPLKTEIPVLNQKFVSELYAVSLKQGHECQLKYGRENYDFQEGTMMFLAPGQSIMPITESSELDSTSESWTLIFHPNLVRGTQLGAKLKSYTFFGYDSHEALHLSERERQMATGLVHKLQEEYRQSSDEFSQELIVSNLELLLNYCKRFYARQFATRSTPHRDILMRFERFLSEYFESERASREGVPSVQLCAKQMGYSPNYLSDLLRKETGKTTREHIQLVVIERAKDLLLGSEKTVSQIAHDLGFEYPQHFSKLFRRKTGQSPAQFRG